MRYSRDTYLVPSDLTEEELKIQPEALHRSGGEWNRFIGGYILDELHRKMLPYEASPFLSSLAIPTLIMMGWFDTARTAVLDMEFTGELATIRDWLADALKEGDDIDG